MRGHSVKAGIAAWLTLLTTVMALLLLAFMLSISSAVVTRTAMTQLSSTVQSNLRQVDIAEGKLMMGAGFAFFRDGVSTLVYSQNKALLAGQVPLTFTVDEPFESGVTRTVVSGSDQYLVLDVWRPHDWESGLWVRGLMEVPAQASGTRNLIWITGIALPIFILLAALGGYLIVRRAFRPLESITATAATINEAKDLAGRIALPRGRDEFSRLAATFDEMFERLEQAFEAEKQFTADASHELRTPLAVIKGACDYARKYDETREEWLESISMIQRQTDSMTALIAQLLSMTRLEQGTELLCQERLDLGALVRSICEEQGYDAPRVRLALAEGVMVHADSGLLARLLHNLIENACKYGSAEGHITVTVSQTDAECLLSVRDDGMGIAADQQDKVWQRFYQVDASRGETGGSGLGLAMVRQIARAHGGEMTLESALGVGSCFTLHLPRETGVSAGEHTAKK